MLHVLFFPNGYTKTITKFSHIGVRLDENFLLCLHAINDQLRIRFRFYEEVECEGDVLWQTQDAYTYVDNPAPKFTPYSGINNAYLVEWIRNDNDPKVKLIVVFVEENGGWKIDNVIEFDEDGPQDKLLFDYSKPPVPAYSDEAYSQELLDKINEMKKTLAD